VVGADYTDGPAAAKAISPPERLGREKPCGLIRLREPL